MKLACQFCLYVVIKSIFLTLSSVFFFFFFFKKGKPLLWRALSPFLCGSWKSSSLCPWEKVNVRRKKEKGKEKRKAEPSSRNNSSQQSERILSTSHPRPVSSGRLCHVQQIMSLYQLPHFPTSQDCFGKLLCGDSTCRLSGWCSMKQRSVFLFNVLLWTIFKHIQK